MKVLFVTKPFIMEPLGIMHLSSAMKDKGHDVDIVRTEENIEEKIKEYQPGIITHSVMTGEHGFYSELIGKLKRMFPDMFFLAGGPHPTFKLEESLEFADIVVRKEGDKTLPILMLLVVF